MQGDQQLRIRVLNRLFFPMIFRGQPCNFQRLNQKTALWIVAKAPMQCGSSIYNWCTQLCLNSFQMLQGTNKLLSQIWDWIFPLVSPPRIPTWWAMNSTISIQLSCLHGFPDPVGQACPIWEAPVVGASISDFYSKEARCCKKEEDSSYGSCLEIIARSTIKHLMHIWMRYHVDELQSNRKKSKELASSTTTRFSNFCSNGWLSLKETYDLNPRKFPSLSDL